MLRDRLRYSGLVPFAWILVYLTFSVLQKHTAVSAMGDCQLKPAFQSPYVVSQLSQPRPARGCSSRERTTKGQEVHVLSMFPAGEEYEPSGVSLTLHPRLANTIHIDSLVLVLHSPAGPLSWTLSEERIAPSARITVLMQPGNEVVSLSNRQLIVKQFNSTSLSQLLSRLREKRFKAITSFTTVQGANTVQLRVGIEPSLPLRCDLDSMEASPSVVATYLTTVPQFSGCLAIHTTAEHQRIIYVLDLDTQSVEGSLFQASVHVKAEDNSFINLMVILKSTSSTHWRLKASPFLRGTILVVADQMVTTVNIPSMLEIRAQQADMSARGQELLDWVVHQYGPVTSFTSISNANVFSIILPPKNQVADDMQADAAITTDKSVLQVTSGTVPAEGVPYHLHDNSNMHLLGSSVLPGWPKNVTLVSIKMVNNTLKMPDRITRASSKNNLTRKLAVYMSWQCLEKTVVITFRKEGVEAALHTPEGLLQLTLRNRNCRAVLNATHYVLSYPLTSCGSQRKEKSNTNAYTNQVFFWRQDQHSSSELAEMVSPHLLTHQDDEKEVEGSGDPDISLHNNLILLHFMNFQGNCNTSLQYPSDDIVDGGESNSFQLDLFQSKDFSPVVTARPSQPLEAVEYSFIYVEASMRTHANSSLCASIEDCWLTDTKNSHSDHHKKNVLIRNSCPSDLSVQFLNYTGLQPCRRRFSFQLNSDFIEQNLFLHCRLVTCHQGTNDSNVNQLQALRQCSDPEEFCIRQSLRPFLGSPHYKHSSIEVRGPIRVVLKNKVCKEKEIGSLSGVWQDTSAASTSSEKPTVMMVGLPTEAVVGVAIASFLIGTGLTALLWFIHHRTDPNRSSHMQGKHLNGKQNQLHSQHQTVGPMHQHHHHSGYDLSGHSGSSTPSSQAPMTLQVGT